LIRAVLDTNILASGLVFAGGAQDAILRRWSDIRFEIVLSQHLIDELDATLQK